MSQTELEKFYSTWSDKTNIYMKNDIKSSERKFKAIYPDLIKKQNILKNVDTIIDFGCGYGSFINSFYNKKLFKRLFGFDYSKQAIQYAKKNYEKDGLCFYRFESLKESSSIDSIRGKVKGKKEKNLITLIDVLEHIPDCINLISELSALSDYFLIKLPLESSFFDNYIIKKEYPGPDHYNGHLREFTVNNVYHFIRQLGLNPIIEKHYVYDIRDTVPPQQFPLEKLSALQKCKFSLCIIFPRFVMKYFKLVMSFLLPRKIFLRLIGGGAYWCLASFNKDHILRP